MSFNDQSDILSTMFYLQPHSGVISGGLQGAGCATAAPIRMGGPSVTRNPVPSTPINNFNIPPLIRTPSGLSIQKATVMTGKYLFYFLYFCA